MKRIYLVTILLSTAFFPLCSSVSARAESRASILSDPQLTSTTDDADFNLLNHWNIDIPSQSDLVTRNDSTSAMRFLLPLNEALLGRWVTNNGRTEYYFAPDQVTVINRFQGDRPDDSFFQQTHQITQVMTYHILGVSEPDGVLQIKIETPLKWASLRTLKFDPNRQTLTELLEVPGYGLDLNNEWVYLGQQEQP